MIRAAEDINYVAMSGGQLALLLPEYGGVMGERGGGGLERERHVAPCGDSVKGEAKRREQLSQATCLLHQLQDHLLQCSSCRERRAHRLQHCGAVWMGFFFWSMSPFPTTTLGHNVLRKMGKKKTKILT